MHFFQVHANRDPGPVILIWLLARKNGCQDNQSDQNQQKNQKNLYDDGGLIFDVRGLLDDLLVLRGEHPTSFFAKYQVEDVTIDDGADRNSK